MRIAALIAVAIILTGCTPPQVRGGGKPSPRIIHHANIETIYGYLLSRDTEALKLRDRRKILDNKKLTLSGSPSGESLESEYNNLGNDEESLKSVLYQKIHLAVKRIAEREGIPCILDSSRCLVYYTSEGDLTEQIINELKMLDVRSAPISR